MEKRTAIKAVTQSVTRHFYEGRRLVKSEEPNRETLEVLKFETDHVSSTSVKLGTTLSLGNYESVRCDIMTTVPHYPEEEEDAFVYAMDLTERRLQLVCGDREPIKILAERLKSLMR
jgi:hypothetical protein